MVRAESSVAVLRAAAPPFALFLISLLALLRTVAPTVYTLDSGEFIIAAERLGIVHAPGYPLYLLALRLFIGLPLVGDLAYRGNLFSALCLALSVPLLYMLLRGLGLRAWSAASASLLFVWGYSVWLVGLFAEVYAPQLFMLALAGWALVRMKNAPQGSAPLVSGMLYGLAVAMCPSSILLAPGVAAAYLALRVRWILRLGAAALAAGLFALSLLYFPWRYGAQTDFNLAGVYDAAGVFHPVDLSTPAGIVWLVSGRQFETLFFADGLLPSPAQLVEVAGLFVRNGLGFGVLLGLVGLAALYRQRRRAFIVWAACFAPYTLFYISYGAGDKAVMFGPSFLLWAVVVAFGLEWAGQRAARPAAYPLLLGLPLLMLAVNFPLLDLSAETSVRQRAQWTLQNLPHGALLFGNWHDVVPLQYLQVVEGQRHDVVLYNLFLFPQENLAAYLERSVTDGSAPVAFINSRLQDGRLPAAGWRWVLARYETRIVTLEGSDPPLDLFFLEAAS